MWDTHCFHKPSAVAGTQARSCARTAGSPDTRTRRIDGSHLGVSRKRDSTSDRWSSSLGGNARLGLPHMRMAIGKTPVRGACLHSQVAPVSIGSPGPNGPLGWYHSSDASPPPPAAKRRALIRAGLILIRVGTGPAPGLPTATPHLIELMN